MNFFYFTGLSIKAFDRKKSLLKNWKTFWSFLMILFYSVMVIFSFYIFNLTREATRAQSFVFLSFCSIYLCSLTTLILTIIKRNSEKEFWKLAENAEEIFVNLLAVKNVLSKKKFLKIFTIMIVIILAQILTILTAIYYKNFVTVRIMLVASIPTIVGRIFVMKFIFFVDVLHFYLDKIRQKLSQDKITISEMKSLMRVFTLCWKMCRGIEDIFGWGLAYYTIAMFLAFFSNGNALCVDIVKSNFNIGPFFFVISNIIVMLVIATSCQNCYKCSSMIASLTFRKNFQGNKGIVEAFALQLKHQRISFEPRKLFVISYKSFVNVRS